MASRLVQASKAFNPVGPTQVFAYDELWLNEYTFLEGSARDLKMKLARRAISATRATRSSSLMH
jgi:hypothetical protein